MATDSLAYVQFPAGGGGGGASPAQLTSIYEEWRQQPLSPGGSRPDHVALNEKVAPVRRRHWPSFARWRPRYHLQAAGGWMNDPCAPAYDPATGLYHVFFQWNPNRDRDGTVVWGSMHWGHASSADMVHWTVDECAALTPGTWYDNEGCFTGCLLPTGLKQQQQQSRELTLFYTGVTRPSLHYTLPYHRQAETLAVARSTDGGATWTKDASNNPILLEPPTGLSVTGWRDPFVAPWPAMDRLLGGDTGLYGVISGGLKDKGPALFLYTIDPEDPTTWTFLSSLVDLPLNFRPSVWSGDMGVNWECANFVTLTSDVDGSCRHFIIVGSEGSKAPHLDSIEPQRDTKSPRPERLMQWMSGKLQLQGDESTTGSSMTPKMSYDFGGQFDHGPLYAVNSFLDPLSGKQVAWGWIPEDDLPQKLVDRQGWSGMLSIPRELKLLVLKNVTGALKSRLGDITSIELEAEQDSSDADTLESFTVRTLGISPAQSLRSLRQGTREAAVSGPLPRALGKPDGRSSDLLSLDVQTHRFELEASFSVSSACSSIGLTIFHTRPGDVDEQPKLATTIVLEVDRETLVVRRPDSDSTGINSLDERAPFTLFSFAGPTATAHAEREELRLHVFFDESALEVFANDRTTITTRVYPASKRCWGIRFWAEDSSSSSSSSSSQDPSRLLSARAWDGLRAD